MIEPKGLVSISDEKDLAMSLEEEYVEDRWGVAQTRTRLKRGVRDPVTTLPRPPPADNDCAALEKWVHNMEADADRVVFVSNCHDKLHGKGCWRGKPGYCRARFPREKFEAAQVDRMSGAIRFAKRDVWINTYNPVLSDLSRCNTDVTRHPS